MTRLKTVAATGLGCTALIAMAAPAGAVETDAPRSSDMHCITAKGAKGCFKPDGDVFVVEDTAADGVRVSVEWQTAYGRNGVCRFSGNNPTQICNYNLRENERIRFRLVRAGNVVEKSAWVNMLTNY